MKVYSYNRRRIKFVFVMAALALGVIVGRLAYIMLYRENTIVRKQIPCMRGREA